MITPEEVTAFQAGDAAGVRAVYREFGGLVYSVAYRVLGSRELAQDAAQQTFVKAWHGAASFATDRELGPWLATIARRTAIDLYRHEARRGPEALRAVATSPGSVAELPADVDRVFTAWVVREAVDALPAEEREVVRLQHLEELTHREIAARLDLPLGTVKSRSFRAHRRLAAGLGHLRDVLE